MKKESCRGAKGSFFVVFILAFFFIFSLLGVVEEFGGISAQNVMYLSGIVAFAVALITKIVCLVRRKMGGKASPKMWIPHNMAKIIVAFILFVLFCSSLKREVFLTSTEMENMLSIEWTIFGISIAIFLIWNGVVIDGIKRNKPQKPGNHSDADTLKYIMEKEAFFATVSIKYTTVNLLVINTMSLIVSTGCIYVLDSEWMLLRQIVLIFTFYLTTNSLILLITDILEPIFAEKKELLRNSKVSYEEVEQKNRIIEKSNRMAEAIEAIWKIDNLSKDEKENMMMKILQSYFDDKDDTIDTAE